jgi:predicted short-subunit dehydrogenase-like oxidoreductase (DUF2520 family)
MDLNEIRQFASPIVIGRGRMGTAIVRGLWAAGLDPIGPLGRDDAEALGRDDAEALGRDDAEKLPHSGTFSAQPRVVLLCVPDGEIATAGAQLPAGLIVGHSSGATGLDVLAPHEAFSLHPLMTVTRDGAEFAGAGAAIAGSTPRALGVAAGLARALGLNAVEIAPEGRVAYHAAASIASNFLVTLEAAAERLAVAAGVERALLVPLVRQTVENWSQLGAEQALTGPVARGDAETVARQREAVADHTPDLLPLFDAMVEATQALAAGAPT